MLEGRRFASQIISSSCLGNLWNFRYDVPEQVLTSHPNKYFPRFCITKKS